LAGAAVTSASEFLTMHTRRELNADMKSSARMTIGDVAAHFGLATHVLRASPHLPRP
jgi:hypothetical protein